MTWWLNRIRGNTTIKVTGKLSTNNGNSTVLYKLHDDYKKCDWVRSISVSQWVSQSVSMNYQSVLSLNISMIIITLNKIWSIFNFFRSFFFSCSNIFHWWRFKNRPIHGFILLVIITASFDKNRRVDAGCLINKRRGEN